MVIFILCKTLCILLGDNIINSKGFNEKRN